MIRRHIQSSKDMEAVYIKVYVGLALQMIIMRLTST